MSDVAVLCPHCGEARSDRDPRVASRPGSKARPVEDVSSAEAAALLAVAGADRATRRPGFWGDFFRTPASLRGGKRLLDLLCIVLTVPLVAGVLLSLVYGRSRSGRALVNGSFGENVVIALLGAVILYIAGRFLDLPWVPTVIMVALAALAIRVALRFTIRHE